MFSRKFIILILLLNASFCIIKARALDLISSYQDALSYNADYLGEIAKNSASQENQVQGRAALLPQINLSGSVSENYINFSAEIPTAPPPAPAPAQQIAGYYHQPTASAQVQQVVFDFGMFSNYTKSLFSTQLADLQLDLARQQLILNVSQAYFDVLYANDTLNAIRTVKTAFAKQLDQAKAAFAAGSVTKVDVNDALSAFDMATANEIKAQNELLNRKTIFHNLTGSNPDLIQPLRTDVNLLHPNPNAPKSWEKLARISNVNVKIADMKVKMALEDIKVAKAGNMPTAYLLGNYIYSGAPITDSSGLTIAETPQTGNTGAAAGTPFSSFSMASVLLQVSIPIFSGGGISSQVRQAMDNYEVSMQQFTATKRQADADIQKAFWAVENGISIVKAQTQALKSTKLKLKSDTLGYEVGIRNSINLVNSEKSYYEAIQKYNQARYNYLISQLQLMFLSGLINTDFLKLININIAK